MDDMSQNRQLGNPAPKKKSGLAWLGVLIIPAMVLAPLWFFFIGPSMRHDRLVEKGVHVPGRLIMVDETGTVVNDSPELELTVEFTRKDGVLDTAITDFVPSRRSLHMFQEGVAVKAAYDPEDPTEITVVELSTSPMQTVAVPMPAQASSVDSLARIADSLRLEVEKLKSH